MRAVAVRLLPFVVAGLLPATAGAWPVSGTLDLKVGSDSIVRSFAKAVAVDDPSLVTAELLPSQELLLTPKKPGRALLYLLNDGQLDAVRLRIRDTGGELQVLHSTEAQREAARKACPKLVIERSGESRSLSAEGVGAACRAALRELLKSDDFNVKDLALMFTDEGVQAQLAEIESKLKGSATAEGMKVAYVGVTLRLTGKAPVARKLELLKVAFDASVGRVLLDDRVEAPPEPVKPEPAAEPEAQELAPGKEAPPQVEIVPMPPEELKKARRTKQNREGSR